MIPEFQVGPIYVQTANSKAKIKVHEGGSSSSKTVSILQYLLVDSFKEKNKLYTVCRLTVPNLKRGPMQDWKSIVLPSAQATESFKANLSDHTWTNLQTGTRIEFVALDDEQKARGPRRNRLFVNEANEIPLDTAKQLMRRTSDEIIFDYNPSLIKWWIDTEIIPREDAEVFYSTYKDNPFLSPDLINEIEADVPVYRESDGTEIKDWKLDYHGDGFLIKGDPYEWGVYGLGRRGSPSEAIYPFIQDAEMPEGIDTVVGLDFGFEHPMSICRVGRVDSDPKPSLYIDQLAHVRGLTVAALIERLPSYGVKFDDVLICDNSRPEAIMEIQDAGYTNAEACTKGAGSVIEGIDWMKRHNLYFTRRSEEAKIQFQNYRRRKIRGEIQEEPLKHQDDAPDAVRYAAFGTWGRPQQAWGVWGS